MVKVAGEETAGIKADGAAWAVGSKADGIT
jgi:hypothetical protein